MAHLFKSRRRCVPSLGSLALASVRHAPAIYRNNVALTEETPYTSLDQYRLVGFGSGVYYGRMHDTLFEWLRDLPDAPEATKPAFVFSTSGLPFLAKLWHAPLKKLLARKGYDVVGEFACRGLTPGARSGSPAA